MSYRVEISSAAQGDLEAIRAWYDVIHPDMGDDFILSVIDTVAHIRNHPAAYALVHGVFRRAVIRRFPYGILFHIEDNIIQISGVFHTRRAPETWQSRRG